MLNINYFIIGVEGGVSQSMARRMGVQKGPTLHDVIYAQPIIRTEIKNILFISFRKRKKNWGKNILEYTWFRLKGCINWKLHILMQIVM